MEPLRPLTLGELLDRTFQLYRNNFALFAGITALGYLPLFLGRLGLVVVPGAVQRPGVAFSATMLVGLLTVLVLYFIGMAAAQAGTVVAVSYVHLGRPITVRQSYAYVRSMVGRVILVMIGVGIGVTIGLILLIVPGIIFFLMWALAIPVTVLEGASLGEAVSRSRMLTAGHRGRVFLVYLVFTMLAFALGAALETPLAFLIVLKRDSPAILSLVQVAGVVTSYLSQVLVSPLITIALSLMYFDERVRKEALDIDLMVRNLETEQGQSAAAPAL